MPSSRQWEGPPRMLERDGMVLRKVTPTTPPQVEYSLTELGKDLSIPVGQLAMWAVSHLDTINVHRKRYDEIHGT